MRVLKLLSIMVAISIQTRAQQDIKTANINYWGSISVGHNSYNYVDPSAAIEVGIPNGTKATFLQPTLTTNISTPKKGFIINRSTDGHFMGYNGLSWDDLSSAGSFTEVDPIFSSSASFGITSGIITNWNIAYNKKINSINITGTTTKTINLPQQDGSTLSGSFTDLQGITTETDPIVSSRTLLLSGSTGISVSGGTQDLSANRTWTITNSAPDQTVTLTAGSNITIGGTYPNFTISATSGTTPSNLSHVYTDGSYTLDATEGSVTTWGTGNNTVSFSVPTATGNNGRIITIIKMNSFSYLFTGTTITARMLVAVCDGTTWTANLFS